MQHRIDVEKLFSGRAEQQDKLNFEEGSDCLEVYNVLCNSVRCGVLKTIPRLLQWLRMTLAFSMPTRAISLYSPTSMRPKDHLNPLPFFGKG